jgi:hypothetical protein
MIGIILIVVLILILLGGIGGPYVGAPWQYGYGYSHGGIGIVGIILIVLVVLVLMGRF